MVVEGGGGGEGVVSLVDRLLVGWFVVILDIQFPFSKDRR